MSAAQPSDEALTFSQRLRYGAEAVGFFTVMGLFKILGVDLASALGGFVGRHIFYRTGLNRRARENLHLAYPDKSDAEVEEILYEMWDNLGRAVAEYPHMAKFSVPGGNPRILIDNMEISDAAVASGRGVLFVSAHFANWELMALAAYQRGYEGGEVYRPVNNPYVGRWIVNQRRKYGPKEQISKGAQGTRRIFTLLRRGKSIFLLVDQKTNEGVPAPFFGRIAMTTPAPAFLALKLGALLVPVSNERMSGAYFHMKIREPIAFTPVGNHERDVSDLTIRINETIEAIVRERPSQWLWIHRRWPREKDRPTGRRSELAAQALGGEDSRVEREGSSLT